MSAHSVLVQAILETVMDPEIPTLSIVDMGIVRAVSVESDHVTVTITPTYSGCPAMKMIEEGIVTALELGGFPNSTVLTVLSPPWSSDWITERGREALRESRITPPCQSAAESLVTLPSRVPCPHCASRNTAQQSFFGSTACKALYICHSCREPFDYFKAI